LSEIVATLKRICDKFQTTVKNLSQKKQKLNLRITFHISFEMIKFVARIDSLIYEKAIHDTADDIGHGGGDGTDREKRV
jgi:hypothetical protein